MSDNVVQRSCTTLQRKALQDPNILTLLILKVLKNLKVWKSLRIQGVPNVFKDQNVLKFLKVQTKSLNVRKTSRIEEVPNIFKIINVQKS